MEAAEPEWVVVEADFRAAGFLAPSAAVFRDHYRAVMPEWFAVAEGLNRLGQRIYQDATLHLPGKPTAHPVAMGITIVPGCLSAFQGAMLLAERGLGIEAQILIRGVFEAAFWIGYLHHHPLDAGPQLQRETASSEIGLFEASLRHLDGMGREVKAEVEAEIAEWTRRSAELPRKAQTEAVAMKSGYGASYLFYKDLSGSAVHPSMKSAQTFIARNAAGQIVGHQIGPDDASVGKAVWLGCRSMTIMIDALRQLIDCADHGDELGRLSDIVERLQPYGSATAG